MRGRPFFCSSAPRPAPTRIVRRRDTASLGIENTTLIKISVYYFPALKYNVNLMGPTFPLPWTADSRRPRSPTGEIPLHRANRTTSLLLPTIQVDRKYPRHTCHPSIFRLLFENGILLQIDITRRYAHHLPSSPSDVAALRDSCHQCDEIDDSA